MSQMKKVFSVTSLAIIIIMIANFSLVNAYMPVKSDNETILQVSELLKEIQKYDYGSSRESLTKLSDLVRMALDKPELKTGIEKEMIDFLQSDALFAGKQFVAAGSYHKRYDVHDYDWNGTHLNPTWQTSEIIIAAPGDTTRTDWSVYTRERTGGVFSINLALAMEVNKYMQLGFGLNRFAGETEDELLLDRVGFFLHQSPVDASDPFSFEYGKIVLEPASPCPCHILCAYQGSTVLLQLGDD